MSFWCAPPISDESPQWPRPRGFRGARFKEEASLTNFLFFGFLIKGLGAEILAPEDWRKFGKIRQPPDFWLPRGFWPFLGTAGRYNSRYGTGESERIKAARKQPIPHMEIGCPRNKQKKIFGSNRNKPKQDLFRVCFGLFRFVSWNQKKKFSVCFGVSNLYRNNQNKKNCFEMNQNNPEFLKNT
jgi:hypothetical protein